MEIKNYYKISWINIFGVWGELNFSTARAIILISTLFDSFYHVSNIIGNNWFVIECLIVYNNYGSICDIYVKQCVSIWLGFSTRVQNIEVCLLVEL